MDSRDIGELFKLFIKLKLSYYLKGGDHTNRINTIAKVELIRNARKRTI